MSKKFLTVILCIVFANAAFSQSKVELPKLESSKISKIELTNQFLNQKSDSGKVEVKTS